MSIDVTGRPSKSDRVDLSTRAIRLAAWLGKARLTHGALTVVLDSEDRLLLVKERLRERGHWGLPGGFLRLSESPVEAASRELFEEARIRLGADSLQVVAEYKQPWAWHYDHLFLVRASQVDASGTAKSYEIAGSGWFSLRELPPLTRAAEYALERCADVAAIPRT